jgi:hypothetical protein
MSPDQEMGQGGHIRTAHRPETVPSGPSDPVTPLEGHRGTLGWQLGLIATVSLFSPILVWAQSSERAGIAGFLLVAACLFLLGLGARLLMTAASLDPIGSTVAVAILILGFTNAGLLLESYHRPVLVSGVVGAAAICYRLRGFGPWRVVAFWGSVLLLIYPWMVAMTARGGPSPRQIPDPPPITADFVATHRDVLLLVLDGYANAEVLNELYDYDSAEFQRTLESYGFQVNSHTVANYGRTRLSVASMLQLGYPVTEGSLSGGDLAWLLEVIGGDHRLGAWFQANGYRHVYVESGWFGTRCQEAVDTCIRGPLPDESIYDVANRSILKDLPGLETGRSFTRGALRAMEWLRGDLEDLLHNETPELIYAHLLMPHPPLFLDEECAMRAQDGFKGFTIYQPGMSPAELASARRWYGRQVDCVNEVLTEVAALADATDSIAVVFGDHGPDSLGQLYIPGVQWSEEQRFERLSAMLAARAPGCDMNALDSLVNVGRRLVTCLSDAEFPDLPTMTYESELTPAGDRIVAVPTPSFGERP